MIQSFLKPASSSKENKPTIALECNFARKTQNTPNGNAQKYICHVYEIGGDLVDSRLLDVVLTKDSLPNARVMLCLDGSKPHNLIINLLRYMTLLKEHVGKKVAEIQASNVNIVNSMRAAISALYTTSAAAPQQGEGAAEGGDGKPHKDLQRIRPLECQIWVVVSKFESFKQLHVGERRLLLQALRFVAHYFGLGLLCVGQDGASREMYRTLVGSLAFGQAVRPSLELGDKAVLVTRGSDSFEQLLLGDKADRDRSAEEAAGGSGGGKGGVRYRMVASEAEIEQFLSSKGVTRDCWKK